MGIQYYLKKSFKISLEKLFPLSMIYYLFFLIASVVMNLTLSPLLEGIDKTSMQMNPYDVFLSMKNNYIALGNAGMVKFVIAFSLAVTLLLSIYLFMDAANRSVLFDSFIRGKHKFDIKSYIIIGNHFLRRFFQIAIYMILFFAVVSLINYGLNELSSLLVKIMSGLFPIFKYSSEILIFTIVTAVLLIMYLVIAFVYWFLPSVLVVENCSFREAMDKIVMILRDGKLFLGYATFTIVVVLVETILTLLAMSLVSFSIVLPALYPFLFVLYTFLIIYAILFAETATMIFYASNKIN